MSKKAYMEKRHNTCNTQIVERQEKIGLKKWLKQKIMCGTHGKALYKTNTWISMGLTYRITIMRVLSMTPQHTKYSKDSDEGIYQNKNT